MYPPERDFRSGINDFSKKKKVMISGTLTPKEEA